MISAGLVGGCIVPSFLKDNHSDDVRSIAVVEVDLRLALTFESELHQNTDFTSTTIIQSDFISIPIAPTTNITSLSNRWHDPRQSQSWLGKDRQRILPQIPTLHQHLRERSRSWESLLRWSSFFRCHRSIPRYQQSYSLPYSNKTNNRHLQLFWKTNLTSTICEMFN